MNPSTKSIYIVRRPYSKELEDLKIFRIGLMHNHKIDSWKYNRKFFSQAILAPSFANEALDWAHKLFYEMENYWKEIGPDTPTDYSAWMRRFTNDMIMVLITGNRIHSLPFYYDTITGKKIEDSEEFLQSIHKFMIGIAFFTFTPAILRRHFSFFKQYQNKLIKNESPLEEPLRSDMLTSFITANTPRDINRPKVAKEEFLKPMTDEEIRANIKMLFLVVLTR